MSQSEFAKSFKDFCPRCEHLDYVTGFCYKIREKVDQLPVKFGELCNGEYFSLERNSEFLQAKAQYVQKYATAHKQETIAQETVIEKQENLEVQTRPSSLKANKRIVDENVCNSCKGRFTIGENIDNAKNVEVSIIPSVGKQIRDVIKLRAKRLRLILIYVIANFVAKKLRRPPLNVGIVGQFWIKQLKIP